MMVTEYFIKDIYQVLNSAKNAKIYAKTVARSDKKKIITAVLIFIY